MMKYSTTKKIDAESFKYFWIAAQIGRSITVDEDELMKPFVEEFNKRFNSDERLKEQFRAIAHEIQARQFDPFTKYLKEGRK